MHGANSPGARAKAEHRILTAQALADAEAVLAHEGITPIRNPIEELGRVAAEVLALKDALARRVNSLNDLATFDLKGTEQLRVEVGLYERALDRSAKFLDLLVKNGFEEKRVALAEHQALQVASLIRRILTRLPLDHDARQAADVIVVEELQALATIEGQVTA